MAPEMIEGTSCPQSDIWSIGIIVYLMLTGKHPFNAEEGEDLFYEIKNDELDLKPLDKAKSSEEAKDFIKRCLNKDFNKRMTTSQALKHEWINKFCIKLSSNLINNSTVETLLFFANKDALQKEIYYFIAKISSEQDIFKLKNFFHELDVDNSGTLTIEEIEKGFKEINISISEEELKQIWEGLDFHKDGQININVILELPID
jgi:calcium-dependent protein kinase